MPLEQVDLFVSGAGGYHTYRIPALAVSTQGTILAFCEGRKHGGGLGPLRTALRRLMSDDEAQKALQFLEDPDSEERADRQLTWDDVQAELEQLGTTPTGS